MNDIQQQLHSILRDVFNDPTLAVNDEMTAIDIDGWDSLAHINVIIAMERGFGVKFATAEISQVKEPGQNIGSLVRLVERKLSRSVG